MLIMPYGFMQKTSTAPPAGIALVPGSFATATGGLTYDCPSADLMIVHAVTSSRSSLNRTPANITGVTWDGDSLDSIYNTATGNGTTGVRLTSWYMISPKAGSYTLARSSSSGGSGQVHVVGMTVFCLVGTHLTTPIIGNNVGSPSATLSIGSGGWAIGSGVTGRESATTITQVSSLTNIGGLDYGLGSGGTGRYFDHSVDYSTTPGSTTVEYSTAGGGMRVGIFGIAPA